MEPSGDDNLKITNQPSFSLNSIKHYLTLAYSNIRFPDLKEDSLGAIAYSGSIVFKILPLGAEQTTIKLIQVDIKKVNHKNSPYNTLVYISEDNNFQELPYKQKLLSKLQSPFNVQIIPYSAFKNSYLPNLDSPSFIDQELVNKHKLFQSKYKIITPILVRIFNYVHSLPLEEHPPPEPVEKQFLRLDEKIKANFHSSMLQDVHTDVLSFWQTKIIIETFIKKSYSSFRLQFDSMKSRVLISLLKLGKVQNANDELNDLLIFNSIAESILPPELKDDHDAFDCAKALVYYFFEYCLFGKKTKYDDPTFNFPVDE